MQKLKFRRFLANPESRINFKAEEHPLISIIIVTFNKVHFTYACLESVKSFLSLPFEIIIADNASTDRTGEFLSRINGANILRNSENHGFIKAVNQAAKQARGKYLLFLNNDAELLPGCVENLVSVIEKKKNCGAVGCKIIYQDGALQEAGSIIWKSGTASGYGRGDDPNKSEYSYLKEVDYCSAVCLLTRADLFARCGGFDIAYSPAYYEDADYGMCLRKHGFKTFYQPSSIVFHQEFGSSSLNESKKLMRLNRDKFKLKWKSELEKQYEEHDKNLVYARERIQQKKILIIDDRIPAPYLGSGFPRMFDMINALNELNFHITIFPVLQSRLIDVETTRFFQGLGVEVFYNNGKTHADVKRFLKARAGYYDYVLISRPHNAEKAIKLSKKICSKAKIIYDFEAIFALRDIKKDELNGNHLSDKDKRKALQKEISLLNFADTSIGVSAVESDLIKKMAKIDINVLGHVVSPAPTEKSFDERNGILFVGGFLGKRSPNEDAMLYFVEKVFPRIKEKLNVKLFIVGNNSLEKLEGLISESVVVKGRVKNLEEYYNNFRVFVVPTRFASGIPYKLHEAMKYGLPAVVTPLISEQLQLKHEKEVLIGENPVLFADNVIRLYNNRELWENLREQGLQHITEECSGEKFKSGLMKIFG